MFLKRFVPSQEWVAYFRENAQSAAGLSRPEAVAELPDDIRRVLASSLTAWQLGETSDGRHLRKAARQYAQAQEDWHFLEAVDLFIAEEQRHGAALGDWLDRVGIPRKKRDAGDTLFRFCRYAFPNYAVWASVVVMVESMAELYYASVRRLTPCPRLKMECERILQDEVKHIQFQCEHLASSRRRLSGKWLLGLKLLELAFYTVVCAAVWAAHGQLFRRSGTSLGAYIRAVGAKFRSIQRYMDPRRYDFGNESTTKSGMAKSTEGQGVILYRLSSRELRRILNETKIKAKS